jgi:hypothetical protein
VKLLQGSDGYVRTELTKEVAVEGFYRVLDVWKSHYHFESFRTLCSEDLKQFAEMVRASGIVVSEIQLGAYYGSDGSGSDEGTLAPA